MSFRDIANIKTGYDSGFDDILNDFYVPILKETKRYRRIAGFFSSSSLSVAARGIVGLISNGGKVEMIVSPRLSKEDIEIIEKANTEPNKIIANVMLKELDQLETILEKDRINALGWLLAKGFLEIKIATVYDENNRIMDWHSVEESGLFHIKVGILEDCNGDIITFSGSINETASAWVKNVEEFKVFKSWLSGQNEPAQIDINKFNKYWNSESKKVKIIDMPTAVTEKLIKLAPKNIFALEQRIILEEQNNNNKLKLNFTPFPYQKQAFEIWQNRHSAIFEMATGTGKTKTAELCIADFINETSKINSVAVVFIVCPQNALARQWFNDLKSVGIPCDNYIFADSSTRSWRDKLTYSLLDVNVVRFGRKNQLFVFCTFQTFSSKDFISIVKSYKKSSRYFLIADEVHGLGAPKRNVGLIDEYDYRLGLSATPDRWFDEIGTKIITDYFGEDKFVFGLKEALQNINPLTGHTYLTKYKYIPRFVTLTEEELSRYMSLSRRILCQLGKANNDSAFAEKLERLVFLRANIHKNAERKYQVLNGILNEIGNNLKNTIIFVSPEQLEVVENILLKRRVRFHTFTMNEGNKPLAKYANKTEREHIISCFKAGDYHVLVAIKCLDEGIDIPSAEIGIILASSTNPREYIQRIGRIIRYDKNKKMSFLYDIIVEPNNELIDSKLYEIEHRIFKKEMQRIKEISENAENRLEIINTIYQRV